jgi:hypothetical protein
MPVGQLDVDTSEIAEGKRRQGFCSHTPTEAVVEEKPMSASPNHAEGCPGSGCRTAARSHRQDVRRGANRPARRRSRARRPATPRGSRARPTRGKLSGPGACRSSPPKRTTHRGCAPARLVPVGSRSPGEPPEGWRRRFPLRHRRGDVAEVAHRRPLDCCGPHDRGTAGPHGQV